MIKQIQKYLLLNYPLVWNLKIIPILLTAIIGNILTFAFGYFTTSFSFNLYYGSFESHFISTLAIYIVVILILILWLVAISKNNAFKNYYPSDVKKLYLQWILIGISIFSTLLMPFCFERGINTKMKSYVTKDELIKEGEVLNMVKILLPTPDNYMSFYQEVPTEVFDNNYYYSKGPNGNGNYNIQRDSLFFNDINNSVNYEDYPNFSQFSLLNYNVDKYDSFLAKKLKSLRKDDISLNIRNEDTVKDWLIAEKSDSIKNLMISFINIQNKYKVSCNLTADEWFKLLYNPPKYVVSKNNLITDHYETNVELYGYNNTIDTNTKYYVTYYRLSSNLQTIADAYNNSGLIYLLSLLYATLALTMLTFAFRVTSGKDWLIALVSLGIFSIIVWILVIGMSLLLGGDIATYIAPSIYILLFVIESLYVYTRKCRGYSGVLVNHIIGLLPIIPLIILGIIKISVDTDTRDIITDNYIYYFSANLILTLLTMPFMTKLIIKWKGISEN